MTVFPLPSSDEHARLARRLAGVTTDMVTQAQPWSGRINQEWATPVNANAWTALLTAALYNDPDSDPRREVEVRLAVHGMPSEGVGELPGNGTLWLLAQQQDNRFMANATLWKEVREHLRPLVNAQAALDAVEVLLTPSQADPWGLRATLYYSFMRAWREGRLATDSDDRCVLRFLGSPLAFWSNVDVSKQALTFASEHIDPSTRLRRLGAMFQLAPKGFLDTDTSSMRQRQPLLDQLRDCIQQGARLAPDDTATVALLAHLDPALLAHVRAQSSEAPTAGRKRPVRRT